MYKKTQNKSVFLQKTDDGGRFNNVSFLKIFQKVVAVKESYIRFKRENKKLFFFLLNSLRWK